MKTNNFFKKILSWSLSVQIAGIAYVFPIVVNAGTEAPVVPIQPPMNEKDLPAPPPPPPGMETITHAPPAEAKPKKYLCQNEDGTYKKSCIVIGVLLGIAAIILIANAIKKSNKKGSKGGGGGGSGGRPTETPKPVDPAPTPTPTPVPCCQNPAPAPAPAGGGLTETSTVTTGNTPIDGVAPTPVN